MFMRESLGLFSRSMIRYPRKKRQLIHIFHSTRGSLTQAASYSLGYSKTATQPAINAMGFKTVATSRFLQLKDNVDLNLEKNNDNRNDEMTDVSNLQLVKYSASYLRDIRGSNADHFLRIIRCEGELDREAVSNIFYNYMFLQGRIKWSYEDKEKVKTSNEFSEFLKAVEKFLPKFSTSDVISAVCCCVNFQLPSDHDLTMQIITKLLSEIENVPFHFAVLIYHIIIHNSHSFGNIENEIHLKLEQELRKRIQESLFKDANKFSDLDLIQAVHYVNILSESSLYWPEEVLVSLLDAAFVADNGIWKNRCFFNNCYNLICLLNKEKKEYYQTKFYNKLYECLSLNQHTTSFCKFLYLYAFQVFIGNAPYDAKLFDDILSTILSNRTKPHHIKELVSSLEVLGHARFYLLDKMKSMVIERPSLVAESFTFFKSFVTLLVDWNSLESKRLNWEETKTFIEYLMMLNDVSQWEKADRSQYLRLMVSLASIEIFPEKALNYLSEKSTEINENDKFVISYLYVALNQAVTVMHPNYPKPFINEELISSAVKVMRDRSGIPEKLKLFSESITDVLESMLPGKNCILKNKFTKLGHKINLAIAVDNNGRFFNFKSACEDNDVLYIEDILLDSGYEYILILALLETHYIRNLYALRSVAKVRVKTLELLGYKTVYILLDKWNSLTDEQKKEDIVKRIRAKKRARFCNVPFLKTNQ